MKKEDKQKILIEVYQEYLKIKEKNITTGFIQKGLFLGAAVGFLFSYGFIKQDNYPNLINLILIFFFYVIHINNIDNRHFKDEYIDFLKHIKEDKINQFKFKKLSWFENWVYYKRKY